MKNNKSGISLVILAVTIIILIILAGAGIVVSNNMIDNSKKATFADDLTQIQDMVKEYYINNNSLPIYMEEDVEINYTKEQFLSSQSSANQQILSEELTFNKDNSEENIFYRIDLAKIGITSSSRGTGITSTDIYVVSRDTMTVYYFEGYEINDEFYYSLSNRLININKVEGQSSTQEQSEIIVTDISDIKITKSTELITNSISVNIEGTLEQDEHLQYRLSGNNNYITIDALPFNIVIDSSNFTSDTQIDNFNYDKKLIITKPNTTEEYIVDLSNLDLEKPNIVSTRIDRTATNFNTINIEGSEIKNIYYEYITKIDETGVEVAYYDESPTINLNYLLTMGKKTNSIILDKSIQSISFVVTDNAGNATNIYTIDNIAID